MTDILYKIRGKILRFLASLFRWRPDSSPYLSGDGLRRAADRIYDEEIKCTAEQIREGDIVFVSSEKLEEWFECIHKKIVNPYILVSNNGDESVDENVSNYIDEKIIHWFAQNNTFRHNKITPIPIGIENRRWFMSGWYLIKDIHTLDKKITKKTRILYGFNDRTNVRERSLARKYLAETPLADGVGIRAKPRHYFCTLNEYKFVASPEGNGSDCHRTWEAIILGVVPIVRNTSHNQIFEQRDLPVLTIDGWEKIKDITENNLEMIYNQKTKKECREIFLKYWVDLISEKKRNYLTTKNEA